MRRILPSLLLVSLLVHAGCEGVGSVEVRPHGDAGVFADARVGDGFTPVDGAAADALAKVADTAADVSGDGDGLDDWWEVAAGDANLLSWTLADTDADGTPDGDEDPDQDGLTNLEEWRISEYGTLPAAAPPHPFQPSLFVEMDVMAETSLSADAIAMAVEVYAAVPLDGVGGQRGIGVHIILDETDIAPADFDGSFDQRHAFLRDHGPSAALQASGLPVAAMIHAVVVTRRADLPYRGGEVVTHGSGDIEATGVLLYFDALDALHPQCGLDAPYVAPITLDEALAGAFAHELGHTLQLGHDTAAVGGVNFYNLMSMPTTCTEARQRFHGEGNSDPSLGATASIAASRFSDAAVALMAFGNRLSVDTAELAGAGEGLEM